MLDADITRPGQDLLAAYRAHTGPSPEAVERLAAALHADLAKEATAPLASAEPRPDLETADADAVARVLDLAARQRSRRRWTLAAGLLAAAAAIALLALRPAPTQRHAQRDDPAAAFHHEPGAAGSARARAPAGPAADPSPGPALVAPDPPATRPDRPTERPTPTEPTSPAEPSLADEMQRMRPAQLALAAGDPTRALALLATYLETFPDGRLHEEYLALRAIALCSAGPAPAGRTEADAFLAAHPRSIFAERVRGACDPR